MTAPLTSRAVVPTARGQRWVKQLASHLGRKAEVREQEDGTLLVLGGGSCLMAADDAALRFSASADDAASLERVQDVVGRHLERFAAAEGLTVSWRR